MIVGIGFYSYTIGNLTNVIVSMDSSNEELQNRISILKDFRNKTNLSDELF
jgi:hypothetical protein